VDADARTRAEYDEALAEALARLLVAEHRRRTQQPVQETSPTTARTAPGSGTEVYAPVSLPPHP
jgi:hypothetical protein